MNIKVVVAHTTEFWVDDVLICEGTFEDCFKKAAIIAQDGGTTVHIEYEDNIFNVAVTIEEIY